MDAVRAHFAACPHQPRGDGGALAYLFETPVGSILWKDTSGHWAAVLRDLRPDVAILAAAGRANIDGEPVQGSLAEFIAQEVELLHPRQVLLGSPRLLDATDHRGDRPGADPPRAGSPRARRRSRRNRLSRRVRPDGGDPLTRVRDA
jgi:hypothetical protein